MKKLVGEGKPLHSAVDKTAALLKRKVGTGAEFMKELMGVTGVKPTEINERGLNEIMGMPRMTHDQFMANLATRPAPAIKERILADDDTKFSKEAYNESAHEQYTLPGGENYREMLIKAPEPKVNSEKLMEFEAKLRRAPPDKVSYYKKLVENYKNLLSQDEQFPGNPSHFHGEPGILASMRVKDRLVPDLKGPHNVTIIGEGGVSNKKFNTREEASAFADVKNQGGYKTKITPLNHKKYLHLEELQSDWHQQGREKGYRDPDVSSQLKKKYLELNKISESYKKLAIDQRVATAVSNGMDEEEARRLILIGTENTPLEQYAPDEKSKIDILRRQQELEELQNKANLVPDAPFKKNWEEMALKRLIHHAAEKGYHGVVVTPGVEQAKRYRIGNHIDELHYNPETHRLIGWNGGQRLVDKKSVPPEELIEHVGKEVASKLMQQEPNVNGLRSLTGEQLHIGGEGMKGFYDKKVPNILNSIGKKYGVKTELGGHKLLGDPSERADASERLGHADVRFADMTTPQIQAFNAKLDEANAKQLHYFPITEDMRKDVLANGLPLYNKGGTVHMAKDGDMDHMKLDMMNRRMATGGSPTTKGYVTHEPKKPHPEVGTRFKATPQGNLAQMQAFDLMKHEGKGSIVPIPYDATTRDNQVTEVSGHNLINPLVTEAGFDYSLDPTNMAQNIGGASNSGIAKRVQDRVNQAAKEHKGDVFLAPNTMGEDAENFSHHPAHIVLDLMAQRQLNKNTLRALSDDLRGQPETKRNPRTGEVTKTYPYTKFLGYDHPNMMQQVIKGGHGLESTPGDLRKKMMERLSLVNMQKLLDYNMGDLKAAILDPELATDPKAYMGRTFVKAQPNAALRPSTHTSYDTDYTGINEGGLGSNRPLEVLMPDVTESIYQELNARPAKTVKTPAQMRAQVVGAIEKRKEKFAQPINARVINNAGLYEEGLRQGEFNPKDVESVLAYFKRKGGYKQGGAVRKAIGGTIDVKNIGVKEAPNMDVKAFISPRPAVKNSLPVGGVFQQTPQQPMQSMQAPQSPQQSAQTPQAPFPSQGAPAQPPSNILQMTPQGQAMSAIKPPQMARGGKVDRDMMMLHVMNRKMKVKHG